MNFRNVFKSLVTVGCAVAWIVGAYPAPANASVVIAGTRVVYHAGEPETTLKLSNEGKSPSLVQAWIDAGDPKASPSTSSVPFTISPPISRIDPTKGQTLRIIYTGEPLPKDKESVFWLNVLEVPPKPGADESDVNHLQLAFRSRIKLFFRPSGLQGQADDAPEKLGWQLKKSGNDPAIEVSNPTPYHVSLILIEVHAGEKVATFDDGAMVGPHETVTFPLKGDVTSADGATVRYTALNDYGGPVNGDVSLRQGTAASSK